MLINKVRHRGYESQLPRRYVAPDIQKVAHVHQGVEPLTSACSSGRSSAQGCSHRPQDNQDWNVLFQRKD